MKLHDIVEGSNEIETWTCCSVALDPAVIANMFKVHMKRNFLFSVLIELFVLISMVQSVFSSAVWFWRYEALKVVKKWFHQNAVRPLRTRPL